MSERWPGGIISKTAPTPSGPYQDSTAPGVWTLEQAAYYQKLGQWPTVGNINPDAYIENLFSTWLYTGNGSTQTITNGIDLAGKGGLVWLKTRNAVGIHRLYDTQRGVNSQLRLPSTDAADNISGSGVFDSFNANGFTLGANGANQPGETYASWTFRKAPKFFDVVTYTGNGTSGRAISHNLGSTPGMVIVKVYSTGSSEDWVVWHRSATGNLALNTTAAQGASNNYILSTTSTTFSVGDDGRVNDSGKTYVAYLFAHDAGGFGDAGTDNIISCGSVTIGSSGYTSVNLGYEPQFVIVKRSDGTGSWRILDTMRGLTANTVANSNPVYANLTNAEASEDGTQITSTGFALNSGFFGPYTYIYMAIRRPMKTPTSGTQVFAPVLGVNAPTATSVAFNAGFPVDFHLQAVRAGSASYPLAKARLIGTNPGTYLTTSSTAAENTDFYRYFDSNVGITSGIAYDWTGMIGWNFRRATGFFDIVCYTGTGSARTVAHNLGVAPELMIVKKRDGTAGWPVYHFSLGNTQFATLNENSTPFTSSAYWNNTTPTSTNFSIGSNNWVNGSGGTYVAYLFASCPGVSKVGSYTGNGSSQTINCGFSAGARFVLIKRTDSTGNWWVWDIARGMVAGTDPRIALNVADAQINQNWVFTTTNGFEIVTTDATVNASGGTYIYLAIA